MCDPPVKPPGQIVSGVLGDVSSNPSRNIADRLIFCCHIARALGCGMNGRQRSIHTPQIVTGITGNYSTGVMGNYKKGIVGAGSVEFKSM